MASKRTFLFIKQRKVRSCQICLFFLEVKAGKLKDSLRKNEKRLSGRDTFMSPFLLTSSLLNQDFLKVESIPPFFLFYYSINSRRCKYLIQSRVQ
ncbi:hypothetical protein CLV24_11961 [Pontibacter ummariensis]|uniref:Uncharacterized protein n=1 Tax=Pontibacter ummariensis TaxID=1610492 RepID=A0A239IXB5_9BACT|nr:hypothetical protein CLV24_11961 [Pontibacter ummariensis]SNS98267.1 hypothetical protein SAMN06296052_11961 [Pontibacter ummariensis]